MVRQALTADPLFGASFVGAVAVLQIARLFAFHSGFPVGVG